MCYCGVCGALCIEVEAVDIIYSMSPICEWDLWQLFLWLVV